MSQFQPWPPKGFTEVRIVQPGVEAPKDALVAVRLRGAIADIACNLRHALDHGTHGIFIGDVTEVMVREGRPLLYCEGCYGELAA